MSTLPAPLTLTTPFTRRLGLATPIVQAPVGGASTPALCAAVARAGGLGLLSVTWRELGTLPELLRELREQAESGVWGVNVILQWEQTERVALCLEEGCRVVSFAWGEAAPYVERCHRAGAEVLQTVGSAEEAKRAVESGVDMVVAQGWEAGGHVWSTVGTMALVPRVVDAVGPEIPVIAAGGIGDGRGIAAALLLGAAGAWIGTRFLLSTEAMAHPLYQERLQEATETDTLYSTLFDGDWPDAPHRTLRNSTAANWEAAGKPAPGKRPNEGEAVAVSAGGVPIYRYEDTMPLQGMRGEVEALAMYAGQSVGLVQQKQPAAEIVRDLTVEALEALRRVPRLFGEQPC